MTQTFKPRPRDSMERGQQKARKKSNGRALESVEQMMSDVFANVDARQKTAPRGGG